MGPPATPRGPAPAAPQPAPQVPPGKVLLRGLALAGILWLASYLVLEFVETVDWDAVVDALGRVTAWQLAVLFLLLLVRATLNASPLSTFLGDLSLLRATVTDLTATLVSMFAPPPADTFLRVKLFSGWGIEPARGIASATMNVLTFYINRLLVPIVGAVGLALTGTFEPAYAVIGLVTLAAGLGLLTLSHRAVREPGAAEGIGRRAGALVGKVRRSVDPEAWGAGVLDFRNHVVDRFGHTMPRALGALFVMTVVDACILLLAIRFVGVGRADLPALLVICAFLVMYPLTMFPFGGLGLLDTVLLTAYVATAGEAWEAEILAGLVVYRVISIGGPILLGLVSLGLTSSRKI